MSLDGKVALVTGGSRGIGAATAKKLAASGAAVAVNYSGSQERAEKVVADIEAAGGKAFPVQANVSDASRVGQMFEEIVTKYGKLDILINNAGVGSMCSITEMALEDYDKIMDVNVKGGFMCTWHFVRNSNPDGGRIIFIGSALGDSVPFPNTSVYACSKAALKGLVAGLARDLGPTGTTVNLVQPGPINTELFPDHEDNPMRDVMKSTTALGRIGDAEEVSSLVSFIAGPGGSYMSGSSTCVDGGWAA